VFSVRCALWLKKKVLIIETGSVLCEVRVEAEETVFIIDKTVFSVRCALWLKKLFS
jgi:molybdopterin-binding protein